MLISFVWLGLSMDAVQVTSGVSKTTNARVSWNILTLFIDLIEIIITKYLYWYFFLTKEY